MTLPDLRTMEADVRALRRRGLHTPRAAQLSRRSSREGGPAGAHVVQGQGSPLGSSIADRLLAKVEIDEATGCLLWTGSTNEWGYAHLTWRDDAGTVMTRYVHRLAFECWVAPIADGNQVHHLCEVRHCLNPRHLRQMSASDHAAIHLPLKTHCVQGHPYDDRNTKVRRDGGRDCRMCQNAANRAWKARQKISTGQTRGGGPVEKRRITPQDSDSKGMAAE